MRLRPSFIASLTALALAVSAAACSQSDDAGPVNHAQSELERDTSPDVPAEDLAATVAGNTAFAFDLYQQIRSEPGNLFYSPHSISLALAMTYAGARGDTATQIAEVFHFDLPEAQLHPAFNALDLALASRGTTPLPEGQEGDPFRLHIANSIWGQDGYTFLQPFLDVLAVNYGAGLNLVDFREATEAARLAINGWVEAQTEDRIKDLIPQGALTPGTRLVLTNAIYFIASWRAPFDAAQTADGAFHRADGSTVTVPFMRGATADDGYAYAEAEGLQVVQVPYQGNELALVLFLPAAGELEAFEAGLDGARAQALIASLEEIPVNLVLPKFRIEAPLGLTQILQDMGMVAPFQDADFSGIDGSQNLVITDVLHKAFVAVDEKGTEAAAATAVIVGETSAPPPPIDVTVDRPFVFVIRDIPTGAILFVGRVVDPGV